MARPLKIHKHSCKQWREKRFQVMRGTAMGTFVLLIGKGTPAQRGLMEAKFKCVAWTSKVQKGYLILVVKDEKGELHSMTMPGGPKRHSCTLCHEVIK